MERTNTTRKSTVIAGALYGFAMGIFTQYMILMSLHLPLRSIIVACGVCSTIWAVCGGVWANAYYNKKNAENK